MEFEAVFQPELLGGINLLRGRTKDGQFQLSAVPYYAWSHRGPGQMAVWLPRTVQ
jgi:hypothetical protein